MKVKVKPSNTKGLVLLNLILLIKRIMALDCSNDINNPNTYIQDPLIITSYGQEINCDPPTNSLDYYIKMVTNSSEQLQTINKLRFTNPSDFPGTMVQVKHNQFIDQDIYQNMTSFENIDTRTFQDVAEVLIKFPGTSTAPSSWPPQYISQSVVLFPRCDDLSNTNYAFEDLEYNIPKITTFQQNTLEIKSCQTKIWRSSPDFTKQIEISIPVFNFDFLKCLVFKNSQYIGKKILFDSAVPINNLIKIEEYSWVFCEAMGENTGSVLNVTMTDLNTGVGSCEIGCQTDACDTSGSNDICTICDVALGFQNHPDPQNKSCICGDTDNLRYIDKGYCKECHKAVHLVTQQIVCGAITQMLASILMTLQSVSTVGVIATLVVLQEGVQRVWILMVSQGLTMEPTATYVLPPGVSSMENATNAGLEVTAALQQTQV